MRDMKRREFLKLSGVTAAWILSGEFLMGKKFSYKLLSSSIELSSEDIYRREFAKIYGESSGRGFVSLSNFGQNSSAWEVRSHRGEITKAYQSARYPSIDPNIPDSNPRGSAIEASSFEELYRGDRMLYPMRRVGERGEGKWERVSWDEVTIDIAQKIFDIMVDDTKGADRLMVDIGSRAYRHKASYRFASLLGASGVYPSSPRGDISSGATIAYGDRYVGSTYDFLYSADTIILWGADIATTNPSKAHYLSEAKYSGKKIVVISSEFNASALSADLWIPIKSGRDSILAASIIHEIIHEKLYRPNFIKLFTDLPLLVIKSSKKLLRRSDVEGDDYIDSEEFYSLNSITGNIALMPATEGSDIELLDLDKLDIDPELEGEWSIRMANGEDVVVTTVFEMLKSSIEPYSPKETQESTGIHPDIVTILAKDIAIPSVVSITVGSRLNNYFDSSMTIWNIASICGLTGRIGSYGGLNIEDKIDMSELDTVSSFSQTYRSRLGSRAIGRFVLGDELERADEYLKDEEIKIAQNGISKDEYIDIIRSMIESGRDATSNIESGTIDSKPWWIPEFCISIGRSDLFEKSSQRYIDALFDKMDYLVAIGTHVNRSAIYADILLPMKSEYESWDISLSSDLRYANLSLPVSDMRSIGEAKDEWSIMTLLSSRIEEIANRAENIGRAKVKDHKEYASSGYHDLTRFYQEFTQINIKNRSSEDVDLHSDRLAVESLLANKKEYHPWSIDQMQRVGGFLRLQRDSGRSSPLYSDRAYNSFEYNLYEFKRFNTLTGRQTFYVDHDIYIKLNSCTNRGASGLYSCLPDRYPYRLITKSSRYSSSQTLQRLQRGVPYITISVSVAKDIHLEDGDMVKVYNELGEFYVQIKLSRSIPTDILMIDDIWEPYMFRGAKGYDEVMLSTLNLLEVADGWGHLRFGEMWDSNIYRDEAMVAITKVEE
jgi:complex iron-sulfur molybdoenzyme family reductase subunit alpha